MEQTFWALDVSAVTQTHGRACARLLGGVYDRGRVALPQRMTASEVRETLGILWRGVAMCSPADDFEQGAYGTDEATTARRSRAER